MKDFKEILKTSFVNKYNEKYLYGINGSLFYKTDSNTIFLNKFNKNFIYENSLYIIAGTDSGLLIDFVIKQNIPQGTIIVFVEFQEIIDWIQENKKINYPKNFHIVSHENLNDKLNYIEVEKYIYLDKLKYIQAYCVTDFHCEYYTSLDERVAHLLQTIYWEYTAELNNKLFIINQFKNIPYNTNHVSSLYGQFKGQSALLLAGGPSLDNCIPWIRDHKNEFVIIAVSRISRRLLNASITPDIIFSVDPQEISFDVSRDMFNFAETSLFIHAYHTFHPMVAQWPGRKAYVGALFPWRSPLNIPHSIEGGATVTNFALACALKMGFSQIVLCGVDLCYSPEGNTHASFSKDREDGPALEGSDTKIETYSGVYADTTFAYKSAAQHIQDLANHEIARSCTVINSNINAAKINGISFKELSEIEPLGEKIISLIENFEEKNNYKQHTIPIYNELNEIKNKLNFIIKLSKEAINENRKFFKEKNYLRVKSRKKIDSIENIFNSDEYIHISKFIKTFGIKNFLKIIKVKELNLIEEKEAKDSLHDYYTAYADSAKSLIGFIDETLIGIHARQEDDNPQPDYNLLLDYWKNNNIPGRARIFSKNNHQAFISAPSCFHQECMMLEAQFDEILLGKQDYSKVYGQQKPLWTEERRNKLFKKTLDLYSRKDRDGLKQLISNIEKSGKMELHILLHASKGLAAELNIQPDLAIEHYNKVIDNGEGTDRLLLEHSLKRIALLSINNNNYDYSILALKCLSELSIEYFPQYAKILKLSNHKHDALDVYAQYIQHFPDDIMTMLDMATIYHELNIKEGVLLLTDHILKNDPNNRTAEQLRNANA